MTCASASGGIFMIRGGRPPQHLKTTDPYHYRLGLMALAILASLEQDHPLATRIPLAHQYDWAYGPQGYNPYQVIPREERDRLLALSVVNRQVDVAKYSRLLEEAALDIHLQRTVDKNAPQVENDRSVDLWEVQAKLRRLDREALDPELEWKDFPTPVPISRLQPTAKPRTTEPPAPTESSTDTSGWKPLPNSQPPRRNRKKNKEDSHELVPTPEALNTRGWDEIFDLRSDRKKVLFDLGLATLAGMVLIIIYVLISCLPRIRNFCNSKCSQLRIGGD